MSKKIGKTNFSRGRAVIRAYAGHRRCSFATVHSVSPPLISLQTGEIRSTALDTKICEHFEGIGRDAVPLSSIEASHPVSTKSATARKAWPRTMVPFLVILYRRHRADRSSISAYSTREEDRDVEEV